MFIDIDLSKYILPFRGFESFVQAIADRSFHNVAVTVKIKDPLEISHCLSIIPAVEEHLPEQAVHGICIPYRDIPGRILVYDIPVVIHTDHSYPFKDLACECIHNSIQIKEYFLKDNRIVIDRIIIISIGPVYDFHRGNDGLSCIHILFDFLSRSE